MSTQAQLKSWEQTVKELGSRQREVVLMLQDHPAGLSAWQLSNKLRRFVHATRPRLSELHKMGLIAIAGQRFEAGTQRHETVWKIAKVPANQMDLF